MTLPQEKPQKLGGQQLGQLGRQYFIFVPIFNSNDCVVVLAGSVFNLSLYRAKQCTM